MILSLAVIIPFFRPLMVLAAKNGVETLGFFRCSKPAVGVPFLVFVVTARSLLAWGSQARAKHGQTILLIFSSRTWAASEGFNIGDRPFDPPKTALVEEAIRYEDNMNSTATADGLSRPWHFAGGLDVSIGILTFAPRRRRRNAYP